MLLFSVSSSFKLTHQSWLECTIGIQFNFQPFPIIKILFEIPEFKPCQHANVESWNRDTESVRRPLLPTYRTPQSLICSQIRNTHVNFMINQKLYCIYDLLEIRIPTEIPNFYMVSN